MKTDFSSLITTEQWLSTDDHALAKLVNRCVATVRRERKRLGHPPVRKAGTGRKPKVKLKHFDLKRTDTANAEKLGISRQRANQIRKQLTKEEWE